MVLHLIARATRAALVPVALVVFAGTVEAQARKAAAPATPSVSTDPAATLPMTSEVTTGRLPNGIRYYIRENRRPEKRAELRLVVNAGSVLEDDDQRGIAHFVEHMAFNGTKNFEKQKLVNYLESIGMRFGPDINAYTSFDETVYMLQVPTDSAHIMTTALQILEDWAHLQTFDSLEIEKERGVVVEEWRGGRGAGARVSDKQFPVLLGGSRYANRLIIGTQESLLGFSPAAARRFYADWYRPELMAIVAVGDFDRKAMEKKIRAQFSRIAAKKSPRARTVFPVPEHDSTRITIATDKELTNTVVVVNYKHPVLDITTVGGYRQSLLGRLYNGMLNRRFSEMVQTQADPPFIGGYSARGGFVRSMDAYQLAAVVKDGGIERGLDAIYTEAQRVDRFGFTATELERQKQDYLRGMERAFAERDKSESDGYADELVSAFLEREPVPGIAYEYELAKKLVPAITLEEINQLGRSWITDRNRVILVSAPEKAGVSVPTEAQLLAVLEAARKKEVVAYKDETVTGPLMANVPAPAAITSERRTPEVGVTELKLANGVRVVLKPTDFKADQILLSAWSPGGTSLVADSVALTADLADAIVGSGGLGLFSSVALRKALSGKAVNVSPSIDERYETFSGSASPKDVETMLQLVHLYFTTPRTDSVAFTSMMTRFRAQLENRAASPDAHYGDTLTAVLTRNHPRTRPITADRLKEIDLGRAMTFYRDRFADASDFTFYLVGNFSVDSMKPLVQQYLGTLPSLSRKESWRDLGIEPPRGIVRKVVRKGVEPKARTQIIFSGPFEFTRENRFAIQTMLDVLRIKLREQLREEQGGTYGVGVGGGGSLYPKPRYSASVSFGTSPERLDELTRIVFQQIDSLKAIGASASDLAKVKEIMRRDRETALKQNGFWMGQLTYSDRHGIDYKDMLTWDRMLDGVTAESVKLAARKYLDTANYVQVSLVPEGFEAVKP